MALLTIIKETAQQTAEAISEALGVHVEISDSTLQCIAGTGELTELVGTKLTGHIHSKVLQSGTVHIIKNPGYHDLCKPCYHLHNCYATAEICVPILKEAQPVGVIGLVSLNEAQKEKLLNQQEQNVLFLKKMSDLLSSKLDSIMLLETERLLNSKLKLVINFMDQGVIVSDGSGYITHVNHYVQELLGDEKVLGRKLISLLPLEKIKQVQLTNTPFKQEEFDFKLKNQNLRVVGSAHPVMAGNNNSGVVVNFQAIADTVRISYNANSSVHYGFEDIIGVSQAILKVKEKAAKISASDSSVLITGETGTGKEILARAIHSGSDRRQEHFITINCGAIPEALLESELFGYEDGAFTGARKGGKLGKFEIANGGTIFLDEIGDMPLHLQVKLLRVLQEKVIEKVGGTFSVPVNVRIIAATHCNLEELANANLFRWDLYYRLNIIPLYVPPLRQRQDDILILAKYFLELYSNKFNKEIRYIAKETENLLLGYDWPGNVRELSNAMEYAINMEESNILNAKNLPLRLYQKSIEQEKDAGSCLKTMEMELIADALKKYGGSTEGKKQAAQALGISLATLYRKMNAYGSLAK